MYRTRSKSSIRCIIRPKYTKSSTPSTTTKPSTKPTVAKPTIKNGSKGTQVKYLQKDLNFILGVKLDVDGIFGGATANALKQFQKKYGLEVDGVYGKSSFAQMTSLIGKVV